MGLISALTVVYLQSKPAPSHAASHRSQAPKTATVKTDPLLLSALKRHPQVNDVTRRFRARPAINLVVTNNIGRLCWPPAQLSGHLDFFQNTCRYCKYRSAGLQEISIPMKPHLERFSKSPTAKSLRGGSESPACKMLFFNHLRLTCSGTSGYPAVCWAGARGKC